MVVFSFIVVVAIFFSFFLLFMLPWYIKASTLAAFLIAKNKKKIKISAIQTRPWCIYQVRYRTDNVQSVLWLLISVAHNREDFLRLNRSAYWFNKKILFFINQFISYLLYTFSLKKNRRKKLIIMKEKHWNKIKLLKQGAYTVLWLKSLSHKAINQCLFMWNPINTSSLITIAAAFFFIFLPLFISFYLLDLSFFSPVCLITCVRVMLWKKSYWKSIEPINNCLLLKWIWKKKITTTTNTTTLHPTT